MNIAIRADGSVQMGLGHLVRCGALAKKFEAEGDHVRFFCSEKTEDGMVWLRQQGYHVEADTLLRKWQADIIIVDVYGLSAEYFAELAKSDAVVAVIDDHAKGDFGCDVVVNGNLDALALDYSGYSAARKLLGTTYAMLRSEFETTSPAPFREAVSDILVTMGGSDPNNFTPTVIKGLSEISGVTIHVVCGSLMKNVEDIKAEAKKCLGEVIMYSGLNEKRSRQSKKSRTPHRVFCDRRDRFRINPLYSSPDSMAELMAKCDLAISAGGGTVKELFAMGVVSLFVVQADNQILLRDYLQNEGLPLYLGTHNDVTAQQIYTEVTKLMNNPNERLRIRTIISSKVDRKGTSNIVAELKVYCIKRRQKVMKFGENFTPSPKNDIIIWGAGVAGRRCYELLKTFEAEDKVIAFVDSDKAIQGATLLNTVVHSPDFVSQESKADIIIATMWYHEVYPLIPNRSARNILVYCERIPIITPVKFELLSDTELYGVYQNDPVTIASIDILQYIRKHGLRVLFSIDTAVNFPGICRYWASEELSLSVYDKLTVVDVGAYDGDTIERWAKSYADKISKIYAFEPDDKTFVALKKNIEAWGLSGKTECFKNGLSNKNQTLSFINAGHMGSRIDSDGDSSITVMPLDELNITVEGKLCIKMDIEGAESEALEGAKETIKKYAPELAISVYHKYDDVLTIPKIIKSINPAYNCILRNGTHMECYASVERFS